MIMEVGAESDRGREEVADGDTACFDISVERKFKANCKASGEINS